ncbi:MAG: carboxypeptidase-like regulatory domain-containing protein [Acidobacteriaceae bacterium]
MKRLVLLLLCGLGCVPRALGVCMAPQPRLVCAEYSHSTLVAEATLIKIDSLDSDDNNPGTAWIHIYTLRVDRIFRGTPRPTIRIYEENSSGRATFAWKIGTQYVLFLFDADEQPEKGLFELDGCGNSGPIAQGRSVLGQIERLQHWRSAFITGVVTGNNSSSPLLGPFPHVEVVARGKKATYKGRTDREGKFSIRVSPGYYIVKPVHPGLSFELYDLSYDPDYMTMQPGSCAQIQFFGSPQH